MSFQAARVIDPPVGPSAQSTILIVEDERLVAKDLQRSLSGMGYAVPATVATADDAIRTVSGRCPDLVLMDIRIKGHVDGIDAAGVLRERFDVPVIFLTAYADQETLARAKATAPFGYLMKPVDAQALRSTIEIALHKHQMERRLREREHLLTATLQSIGDAVISTDASTRVTMMNRIAETLTGWTTEEARGRKLEEILTLVDEGTHSKIPNPIAQALESRRVVYVDAKLVCKNGSDCLIADSAAPIVDRSGEISGAVLVFRDVSEKRRMQRQLELSDRLASLGTMAAGIAHDVNNALVGVTTNLEYISRALAPTREATVDTREVREAAADARAGARHVAKIVSELRAFARPIPERDRRADVNRVIEMSLELAKHEFGPQVRVERVFANLPPVAAEESRLGQVFVNLLINAAHAVADRHFAQKRVFIETGATADGQVFVDVRDTGCGMTDDVRLKIFDPFFTTKGVGKGTGLGLSIVHGIVGSVGGEIDVTSELGVGTRFRVTLPAAPDFVAVEPPSATMTVLGLRVLVIDDDPMVRSALARMLKEHRVTAPNRPQEALRLLQSGEDYDCILCDLVMPEMTGIELFEIVARELPRQAARFVFMTGGAASFEGIEFLRQTKNPYILKPFDRKSLQALIETTAQEHAAARAT